NVDVLLRVPCLHHRFHGDLGHLKLPARVVGHTRQTEWSGSFPPGDLYDVPGVRIETSGERKDLKKCGSAVDLVDAGSPDCAQHGYRLAPKLADGYGHHGILEQGAELV